MCAAALPQLGRRRQEIQRTRNLARWVWVPAPSGTHPAFSSTPAPAIATSNGRPSTRALLRHQARLDFAGCCLLLFGVGPDVSFSAALSRMPVYGESLLLPSSSQCRVCRPDEGLPSPGLARSLFSGALEQHDVTAASQSCYACKRSAGLHRSDALHMNATTAMQWAWTLSHPATARHSRLLTCNLVQTSR